MKKIPDFISYVNESKYNSLETINEINFKGIMGKIFDFMKAPFKDLIEDIKKDFDLEDVSSVRIAISKVLSNVIDNAIKEAGNLKESYALNDVFNKLIQAIKDVKIDNYQNDVVKKFGEKNGKSVFNLINFIINGDKNTKWQGVPFTLSEKSSFKYNKKEYDKLVYEQDQKSDSVDDKRKIVIEFLNNTKTELSKYMEANLKKDLLNEMFKKSVESNNDNNTEEYKAGDMVVYLLKNKKMDDFDEEVSIDRQKSIVGVKKIDKIIDGKYYFKTTDGVVFYKEKEQIIRKVENSENDTIKKIDSDIKEISKDEEKIKIATDFVDFVKNNNDKTKIDKINTIINDNTTSEGQ